MNENANEEIMKAVPPLVQKELIYHLYYVQVLLFT